MDWGMLEKLTKAQYSLEHCTNLSITRWRKLFYYSLWYFTLFFACYVNAGYEICRLCFLSIKSTREKLPNSLFGVESGSFAHKIWRHYLYDLSLRYLLTIIVYHTCSLKGSKLETTKMYKVTKYYYVTIQYPPHKDNVVADDLSQKNGKCRYFSLLQCN